MNAIQTIPPPIIPTQLENGDNSESTLSVIVKLTHGNFTFECLSRKRDKRYRFEHPVLGLVIFEESGQNLVFTTTDFSDAEIEEFKRFVIAWKFLEQMQN